MAQKDYVSRGRSGASRKKTTSRKKKSASPLVSKTVVAIAVAVLVVFVGGLYFISHKKMEEAEILPTHAARPGTGLPPKPEERWRYIKELENRQMGVQTPTEPTSGSDIASKTQLTPEQKQLLEQMQADMRQTPTQLSEVPYNDPSQAAARSTPASRQQASQPTFMQQPVRAPQAQQPAPVQPRPRPVQQQPMMTQTKPEHERPQPMITQAKPEREKPQQQDIAQNAPQREKPKEQEKSQRFIVQCGSFRGSEQAESVRAKLAFEGFESRVTSNGGWNRVVIGPYNNRAGADGTLSRLKGSGISSCIPVPVGG